MNDFSQHHTFPQSKNSAWDFVALWFPFCLLLSIPFLFLPITQDPYDQVKWLVLVAGTGIFLILEIISWFRNNRIIAVRSVGALAFALLSFAMLLSLVFSSPNKVEALLSPYGLSPSLSLLILLVFSQTHHKLANKITSLWVISSALLSFLALLQLVGLSSTLGSVLPFMKSSLWTPVGSSSAFMTCILLPLPFALFQVHKAIKSGKLNESSVVSFVCALLLLVGLTIGIIYHIPQLGKTTLPLKYGWYIAMDTFKEPRTLFTGVGSENFLAAFTQGRSVSMNTTPIWNIRFLISSSTFLHIASTIGILGILAYGFMFILLFRMKLDPATKMSALFALLLAIFMPPSIVMFSSIGLLFLVTQLKQVDHEPVTLSDHPWIIGMSSALAVALILIVFYGIGRHIFSEMVYRKAITAVQNNDGTDAYTYLMDAVKLNPYIYRYHLSTSQADFALATALSKTPKSKDAAQEAKNRELITKLLTQSVEEAKIAVKYAPDNIFVWEHLARLYQSLIGLTTNAETWAVASYAKAILIDPSYPQLRLSLGGVYTQKEDWENARLQFLAAIQMKPDFAIAHYNLAYSYGKQGKYLEQARSFKNALKLIDPKSTDWEKINSDLSEILTKLTPEDLVKFESD